VVTIEDFEKIDMRIGRVVRVDDFPEARHPAWKLEIDFGAEIGVKRSSAQLQSEVLVLGALDDEKGVVLLRPDEDVALGDRIA
jgi:tRNA-binding protein